MKDWPLVDEHDDGIRPAGNPDECFYCNKKIGTPHGKDCVCVTKRVKVEYRFEIEIDIPHHWEAEDFEFHRNHGSWCADNAAGDIERFVGDGCACECFEAKYIETVDDTPKREIRE
ncbi:hypothetical protein M0R72_18510 [Candidatus Pacearchaeota archaeon]|jgi:hypothetical protein|nr:hypothetical protein [Candidatus Pacearchaeota archaeon]